MKAYIEAEDGQAADLNFYVAQQGFRELGFDCVLFESLDEIELDADWPVVGYGGTILRAIERLGCQRPAPLGFPSSLESLAGRKLRRITTKELLRAAPYPIFIKPLLREKAFVGQVVQNHQEASRAAGHLEESMELLASEVVNFVSEYRVFVMRGKAVGCRHYKGDFRVFPALEVADRAITLYEEAPLAYVVDIGVTDHNQTLLIEVNDGFSVGAYGLPSKLYARFLETRWWQMTRQAR